MNRPTPTEFATEAVSVRLAKSVWRGAWLGAALGRREGFGETKELGADP